MDSVRVYCAPVKRAPFEYDWHDLQIKDQCLRRRESLEYIRAPPHKDKPAEFYHAQCIHYGIKPFKTKPAAKRALLEAFRAQGGRLAVPQSAVDIEQELKKEFAEANATAKRKYEADKLERQEQSWKKQVKRKREEDSLVEEVSTAAAKRVKQQPLDVQAIRGPYTVAAPHLSEMYGSSDDDGYRMNLAPYGANTIYGYFDFGAFEGFMQSMTISKETRTVKFQWRGRETGEGESTFGDDNIVQLKFSDDNTFEGHAVGDCFERCEIYGKKNVGVPWNANASAWKHEYDSLDEENYERERVARWH
ncbi:hypothetical protein OHC33_008131 [Knufia fluminis]|uniref:Uncharacterized protein n=1 Tax=Knufia fluminis TaxID=191047 RepID=A0AAN8EB63_9EURO|nr:hypothetical protein OHC33_008131 [Knufia fluminis]